MSIVTCQICNNQFEAKRVDAKYCSDTCKKAARRAQAAVPETRMRKNAYGRRYMRQQRTTNPGKYKQEYKDWYAKHGLEYHAQWRAEHPEWQERSREHARHQYDDKPELKRKHDAAYYQRHKEQIKTNVQQYQHEHREKLRPSKRAALVRYRARLASAEGSWTAKQFQDLCEAVEHCCYYCGVQTDNLTVDHYIPLSRGGTNWIENIVPACPACNYSKQDRTGEEYLILLEGGSR